MNNQYLMPANSKKSRLILGYFTVKDLFVCGGGVILTIVMLLAFQNPNLPMLLLAVSPVAISAFLVFPLPNYHNVLQFITNVVTFYTTPKKYYWKGWCVKNEK